MSDLTIPVILCGGSGSRLWPLSTPERPKQFIPLIGVRSTFQETVLRVQKIANAGPILVVANHSHKEIIESQLAELGASAVILLEPVARDSGAAIAAASALILDRWTNAVAVFVSADHHVPDPAPFVEAINAAARAACLDRIVTIGLRPDRPSAAYGYICPGALTANCAKVEAFIEKPDIETASTLIGKGFLWNSGTFVCKPGVLLAELDIHAPKLSAAARASVRAGALVGEAILLGQCFESAPKVSIDYALMEKTDLAFVVEAEFGWSDIGAWDAVLEASPRDLNGNSLSEMVQSIDSSNCIVRAPGSIDIAIVGLHSLAIVVSKDGSILVCNLAHSQDVKFLLNRQIADSGTIQSGAKTNAKATR